MDTKQEEKKNGSFSTIIEQRMNLMGISQRNFAETVGATQAQLSIFLKGEKESAFLSPNVLDASLMLVGINPTLYTTRFDLARKVAEILKSAKVENIDMWSKDQLTAFTGIKEISCFFDVESKKDFEALLESGVIDYESTYIYFRTLVSYMIGTGNGDKITASTATKLAGEILEDSYRKYVPAAAAAIPFMFFGPIGKVVSAGLSAISAGMNAYDKISGDTSESTEEKIGSQAGVFTLFQKTGTSLIGKALSLLK